MTKASLPVRVGLLVLVAAGVLMALFLIGQGLAAAAPDAAEITVLPSEAALSGAPGTAVTYTIWVTNSSSSSHDVNIAIAEGAPDWVYNILVNGSGTLIINDLGPGEGQAVQIEVTIPGDATGFDIAYFIAWFSDSPIDIDLAILTTTVVAAPGDFEVFLPIVRK